MGFGVIRVIARSDTTKQSREPGAPLDLLDRHVAPLALLAMTSLNVAALKRRFLRRDAGKPI